ncbi:MAG: YHS domain-containing protein [Gammaproteobacteria bacterium]|nr:YHS domain-containing protein [Gammaproteobacteria bacterium]
MKHATHLRQFNLASAFAVTVAVAMFAALLLPAAAWAKDPVYTTYFSNVAVGGYDVTTYFSAAKPAKGKKSFSAEYMGADWHFSSAENRDKFAAAPQQYAPQYGGYCAWAVAQGDTASGDPLLWTLHDGKLYLNYNKKINDRWRADMQNLIAAGDQNWPAVLD